MALTEHWLTQKDSAAKAERCPDGYSIFVHERSDRRGGGTGLLYRDSCDVSMINCGVSEHGSFEYSEWLVKASSYNLWVIVIYRPPYSDDHQVPISLSIRVS